MLIQFLARTAGVLAVVLCAREAVAQTTPVPTAQPAAAPAAPAAAAHSGPKWFEKYSIRGYSQFRYNRLFESNPDLRCEQCDRGIGDKQGFGFRRGRMIFSGNAGERLFVYIQFDYSADASSTNKHFLQIRDAYGDFTFDKKKEFRLRFGQSKVPFGFENMQSSSNRLPLDRADALNSAVANERDMGVFFYWAPDSKRKIFRDMLENQYKGSGDYGCFAIGLYNGQVANRPELNNNLHLVSRFTWPFKLGRGQIFEPGIQAYTGQYTLPKDQVASGTKKRSDLTYNDRRVAGSLVLYPRPFGVLAEWNVGEGPSFNSATDSIETRRLKGGFVTLSYRKEFKNKTIVLPYARFQVYDGGKKHETDARNHGVRETEIGVEITPWKYIELTVAYVQSHRKYQDFANQTYDNSGRFLRIQLQMNY
jgi:hypothetical protein